MHPDLNAFNDTLFNVEKNELEKHIGKKCFVKFKGKDPSWGIQQGEVVVNRALGDNYVEDNIVHTLPADKPRIFEIKHLQKAWGYNSKGQYVPDTIAFRIYAEDDKHQFGQPAHLEDIVFIED